MNRQRFLLGGRALVLLALLCVAVPAAVIFSRTTVHFLASFNMPGAPSTVVVADIGHFNPTMPVPAFSVVLDNGSSKLQVQDNGVLVEEKLQGIFNKAFGGSHLTVTWQMQPQQTTSGIVFRLEDSGDTGILDCTWDNGFVTVNGVMAAPQYDALKTYDVKLRLDSVLPGIATWQLDLRESGVLVGQGGGPLLLAHPLSVKTFDIVRPVGEPAGTFLVDEIKATSVDYVSSTK